MDLLWMWARGKNDKKKFFKWGKVGVFLKYSIDEEREKQ